VTIYDNTLFYKHKASNHNHNEHILSLGKA